MTVDVHADAEARPHKYGFVVRPLTPEEYNSLRDDIRARGVVSPIIVDGDEEIIDGHHRAKIADELGIEYPVVVHHGASEAECQALAISLNVNRRQLTPDDRRALVVALRQLGQSTRKIAEQVGVSHPTVLSDLKTSGKNLPVEKITGINGKTYAPTNNVVGIRPEVDVEKTSAVAPVPTVSLTERAIALTVCLRGFEEAGASSDDWFKALQEWAEDSGTAQEWAASRFDHALNEGVEKLIQVRELWNVYRKREGANYCLSDK